MTPRPSPPPRREVGGWRSDTGRRAYVESYLRAMSLLPAPTRTQDVPTAFGTVRLYTFGAGAGAPVVLLPGRTSGVPMWSANLPGLVAAGRTVHALDALGDAGLSVQTRPIRDGDDQAAWLDEVLTAVGAPEVHLIGHSFGGASALGYALRHPERVATLTLLEPVLAFTGLRWQVYVRATIASLPFVPERWRAGALAGIGGAAEIDLGDPVARMVADGAAHYAAALPTPTQPTDGDLHRLTMPLLVVMAERSPLHDARAAVERARATVPDVRAVLWPGATHFLPMEFPEQVDREVLDFIATHETRSLP